MESKIIVSGECVKISYGFISEELYKELINSESFEDDIEVLEDLIDTWSYSGVKASNFNVSINADEVCESVEDLTGLFTLTVFPEKPLIKFTENNKYAIVCVEFESGEYYEDTLAIDSNEDLVFKNNILEFGNTNYFSILSVEFKGNEIELGETILDRQQFYLLSEEGVLTEI